MSKITKFLSIAIDMLQAMPEMCKEQSRAEYRKPMNANRLYHAMQELEKCMAQERIQLAGNEDMTGTGYCEIYVEEKEKPCIAQVKFFPLRETETKENFRRVNGRIDMRREMTDEDGRLSLCLPAGEYVVEISKGSEYVVIADAIHITTEQQTVKKYRCERCLDLRKEGFYAGDLHHHSVYSSPLYGGTDDVAETPEEVCNSMRAMGLSFGALSDHHNVLNHEVWLRQSKDDFTPIISKEISTSNGHVLALGVAQDVIYQIPKPKDRTEKYLRDEFIRITDEIKQAGGLAQLNHPRDVSVSISWNPDFYDMLSIFDTIEIWNGSHPMCAGTTNAKAGALWRDLLEQGLFIPATTGSDTHNIKANDYHGLMDEINCLQQGLSARAETQTIEEKMEAYKDEMTAISVIWEKLLPFLEEWAETNLTSGGVRTYVKLQGEPSPQKVMEALRTGKSFLTNGPILLPSIQGKTMGEKVLLQKARADIFVKLYSNHKLSRLYLHTKGGKVQEIKLEEKEEDCYYDYSMTLEQIELRDTDFIFFVAMDSPVHMAITNPIFLKWDKTERTS